MWLLDVSPYGQPTGRAPGQEGLDDQSPDRSSARVFSTMVIGAALTVVGAAALVAPVGTAGAAVAAVKAPPGAGTPVAASGIGTSAALDNPKCQHDNPNYGVYGRFSGNDRRRRADLWKPWKTVTTTAAPRRKASPRTRSRWWPSSPTRPSSPGTSAAAGTAHRLRMVDRSPGGRTRRDPRHLIPLMKYFETWGRDVESSSSRRRAATRRRSAPTPSRSRR